jgi:tetratricopeptide (TPR) repeat protein
MAHYNLGLALKAKNRLDKAIAAYKKAIDLDPNCAAVYFDLGRALRSAKRLDEAVAAYKAAIKLQPDYPEALCNLGLVLRSQGQLSASLDFIKRGHTLGSKRQSWRYRSDMWLADAERLVWLEAKLPDVVAGKAAPADDRERLGLLDVCQRTRRYAAGAKVYVHAFSADPKLAQELRAGNRYDAACLAALAAAGKGTDAGTLDKPEQSRLRQQALTWLWADLKQWSKQLEDGKPEDRHIVRDVLMLWQRVGDLVSVRDADGLSKLPAKEQRDWRNLWAEVPALLSRAGAVK